MAFSSRHVIYETIVEIINLKYWFLRVNGYSKGVHLEHELSYGAGGAFRLATQTERFALYEAALVVDGVTGRAEGGARFEGENDRWLIAQPAHVALSPAALCSVQVNTKASSYYSRGYQYRANARS